MVKQVAADAVDVGGHGLLESGEAGVGEDRVVGARVDDVTMSVPRAGTRFAAIPPAGDEEIADTLPTILATLAAAVPTRHGLVLEW